MQHGFSICIRYASIKFSQSFPNLDIGTYLHEDMEMDIGRIARQCIHLDIILCEEFT